MLELLIILLLDLIVKHWLDIERYYLKFILVLFSFTLIATVSATKLPVNGHLVDLHGKEIPFKSLKGECVLINYWASWCQPCLDEIIEFNRFYRKFKDKIVLFAVNFDYISLPEQLQLIEKFNIHYPSLSQDPRSQLGLESIQGVPMTFIFNRQGKFIKALTGGQTLASLQQAVLENCDL